jgi:hypothetical protein
MGKRSTRVTDALLIYGWRDGESRKMEGIGKGTTDASLVWVWRDGSDGMLTDPM